MKFDTHQIIEQLEEIFTFKNPECENLNTLANDVVEVTTPTGHFALKLYNPASRKANEIQWEIELTLHLITNGVLVAKPIVGKNGYLNTFMIDGQERVGVLFEWADGEKPKPEKTTYVLLGKAAGLIHQAADSFRSSISREKYDASILIDEQLKRMHAPLVASGQLERVVDLSERLRKLITNPNLDWGICHMDLTLDNVHRSGDILTVFDFDSAGESWRAVEPYGVLRFSEEYFKAWLEGYRSVRKFSKDDEKAVAVFGVVEDIRNVVWKLGLARSSRGEPLLQVAELPRVVDEWLEWEQSKINR